MSDAEVAMTVFTGLGVVVAGYGAYRANRANQIAEEALASSKEANRIAARAGGPQLELSAKVVDLTDVEFTVVNGKTLGQLYRLYRRVDGKDEAFSLGGDDGGQAHQHVNGTSGNGHRVPIQEVFKGDGKREVETFCVKAMGFSDIPFELSKSDMAKLRAGYELYTSKP